MAAAGAAALLALFASVAAAHRPATGAIGDALAARLEQADPRDAPPPLDLKEVDTTVVGARLQFSIVTWTPWRAPAIHDRAFLVVRLYSQPGGGADYSALVRSNGRHLRGILLRDRAGRRERRVGSFRVWRSDRQSVSFRLPLRRLALSQPGAVFSWHAQAILTSERCKRVCFDRAPDQGAVAEAVPPPPPVP
jgi:hypothetical protein